MMQIDVTYREILRRLITEETYFCGGTRTRCYSRERETSFQTSSPRARKLLCEQTMRYERNSIV